MTSRAQGVHGSGGRDFTEEQSKLVLAQLRPETYLTVAQLSGLTGVEGRTVRSILSWNDGLGGVLLAGGDEGYKLAVSWDEAEPMTRRLESQARKMADRASRRRRLADGMHRTQGSLL